MSKVRLDQLLFDRKLTESRERAKAIIMSGIVYVNGQKSDKPGTQVAEDVAVEIRGNTLPYVSRGGLKLEKALQVFAINPEGRICADCGASTGGFTDVLLQNGACKVYAVDVGYGQLAWKLRNDERVINMERTNVRYISPEIIPERISLATIDVSFISLKLILPAVYTILDNDADIVCLIKPQFEAGREKVGKKGVVSDPAVHKDVIETVLGFASDIGYSIKNLDFSPIKGPEGNIEYICHLTNNVSDCCQIDINRVVEASHSEL